MNNAVSDSSGNERNAQHGEKSRLNVLAAEGEQEIRNKERVNISEGECKTPFLDGMDVVSLRGLAPVGLASSPSK